MKAVPFYSYPKDDTHCFQASVRMVLKYFLPDREYSWEELDSLSAKQGSKSTWPQQMMLYLKGQGFDITIVEGFDAAAFIRHGGEYLRSAFGDETADWQIKEGDISKEQTTYQKLLDSGVTPENRIPDFEDVKKYLDKGYLVILLVNSRALNNQPGYVGHFVLMYDLTDTDVYINDPGPPAHEARKVTRKQFEKAWAYPNETAKYFVALAYNGSQND